MLSTVTPIPTINSDGTLPNIEGYLLLLAARTGGREIYRIPYSYDGLTGDAAFR